jgi:hypothetical protein
MSRKTHLTAGKIESRRGFKELNEHVLTVHLKHSATANLTVGKLDLTELIVFYTVHLLDKHQGTCNFFNCSVFSDHLHSLLYSTSMLATS